MVISAGGAENVAVGAGARCDGGIGGSSASLFRGTADGVGVLRSSGSSSLFFALLAAGDGLFFGFARGVSCSSSSSFGVGDFFAFALPFFFAAFGFPDGVSDSDGVGEAIVCISSRAFKKASRFFFASSESCACSAVATKTSSAAMHQLPNDLNPPMRDNTDASFKQAAVQRSVRPRAAPL